MQQDLTSAVNSLIELTYKAGAPDNVTVIVAEVGESKANIKTQGFGAAI
jgi:serine/threonine protein phosphatase PrpC